MNRIKFTLSLIVFLLLFVSCKDNPKEQSRNTPNTDINITNIDKSFNKWWIYQNQNIDLSSDFKAFNDNGEEIGTKLFFEIMSSGNYIPIKLATNKENGHYQLYKLGNNADAEIKVQIRRLSDEHFTNFKKIGTKFPDFNFRDLKGTHFSNDQLKGKMIVVKTWFIACKPCIAEFPELNELAEKYKNNNDIVFLSLALDQQEELEKFLLKKPFNYKVIPNQKAFIKDKLKTNKFPTHIIVDKNGNYLKIPDGADKLIAFLNNAHIETQNQKRMPPPPPPPPSPPSH